MPASTTSDLCLTLAMGVFVISGGEIRIRALELAQRYVIDTRYFSEGDMSLQAAVGYQLFDLRETRMWMKPHAFADHRESQPL